MDSWSFVDTVKAEKAFAMRRYNRLRTIGRLFRLVELLLLFVLLSWTLSKLPFALHVSFTYLRLLSAFVSSPLFVFLLCNAIIVSLLTNSRRCHVTLDDDVNPPPNIDVIIEGHVYDNAKEEEVVYEDKEMDCVVKKSSEYFPGGDGRPASEMGSEVTKDMRRTKSAKFERDVGVVVPGKLRRSETENCRKMVKSGEENVPEDSDEEDGLSNEEFQRAIEAFIERQKRFRHQEEYVSGHCASGKPELMRI